MLCVNVSSLYLCSLCLLFLPVFYLLYVFAETHRLNPNYINKMSCFWLLLSLRTLVSFVQSPSCFIAQLKFPASSGSIELQIMLSGNVSSFFVAFVRCFLLGLIYCIPSQKFVGLAQVISITIVYSVIVIFAYPAVIFTESKLLYCSTEVPTSCPYQ